MSLPCHVKPGEKGSRENPLKLDELGDFLSSKTGQKIQVLGFTPVEEKK
jgi:hypothetical protein